MSGTPFFTLPFVTPNPNALVLDPSKVAQMFPTTVEPLAQAHWLYGSDNTAMTDLVSQQAATCAAGAPTQSTGFLTTPDGGVDAINSGIPDAASQTIAMVFKLNTAANTRALMGAWHQGGGVGTLLWWNATGPGIAFTIGSTSEASPTPPTLTNGTWLFVAKVSDPVAGETIYWGNAGVLEAYHYSAVKTVDATKNVFFAGSLDGTFGAKGSGLAMSLIEPLSATAFQVAQTYLETQATLAGRGITVF